MSFKRWMSLLIVSVMMLGLLSTGIFAVEARSLNSTTNWTISKSKSATELDQNYESKVTLSLPSTQEQLISDVVFVLDKSMSAQIEKEALAMLANLKEQVETTGAKVKVGVVIFNKEARTDGFMDLATEYNDIEAAFMQGSESGTNTHAGLLTGKKMLDEDISVDNSRKYLIFVSDGRTYIYNEEPTATAWSYYKNDRWRTSASPENWKTKYGTNDAPENWDQWLEDIERKIEAQGATYEYPYGGTPKISTPQTADWNTAYANTIDKALYLTKQVYDEAQAAGYHCYAKLEENVYNYRWAGGFMNYLSDGKEISFTDIQNDICYLLDKGSTVTDYMGYVEDDYDFDFINDAAKLTLKVDEETYSAEKTADNEYSFNDGAYTVTYTRGNNKEEEHFVLHIHVPVSNFSPIQLTYAVKLTNPKDEPGTYGQYDEYGEKHYSGLFTNNSATLIPVDTEGIIGEAEAFNKPTVSYTTLPRLNKENHFAYIVGYPDNSRKPGELLDVCPESNITRAESATIFFRLLENQSRIALWSKTNSYNDVEKSQWFNNAISTMTKAEILGGDPNGDFRPNDNITRAEFAAIATRFEMLNGKTATKGSSFSDVTKKDWFYEEITLAEELNYIKGYEDGSFHPNAPIKRDEVMTLVNRVLERAVKDEGMIHKMVQWADNQDKEKWYYAAVQEATNSHTYERTTEIVTDNKNTRYNFCYEIWTELITPPNWVVLEKVDSEPEDLVYNWSANGLQ